ncbi:MAG TPA: LacI family DNA-binding transcriptional regulator [Alphaproteobacteria bacterium]|nr:LacI family DNA-binding transcriptional regulator [Alphaproteobacteria bacterium]
MKRNGIHKIAELAKVSIGTVDRALHGRPGVSEATRKKVLQIAKKLDYTPHPAARLLSGGSNFKIGVCIPKEIHFFYDQMRAGIFDEAQRASGFGLELLYTPVRALGKGESGVASELLDRGVNGLILTPGDPDSATPLIDRAETNNVRVVCITTDAPNSHRSSVVCVDPELNGRLAAELMSKFVGADAEAAVITGMLSTQEHRLKVEGFCTGFETDCRGGRIAAVLEAHETEKESYDKTCELLSRHPGLSGIYVSTVNCLPVCRALEDHDRAGQVALITTDLFPEMVRHLQSGTIRASIYQNPYLQGQVALRLLVDNLLNGMAIPHASYLNPGIVLRTNVHLFREAQEDKPLPQTIRKVRSFGS